MDFILWWQTLPEKMDPILLSIGSFSIYWYSTMYLVAFGVVYLLCRKKINNNKFTKLTLSEFEDLLSWCFIALILGARFGYVLFYNFEYYLANPLEILLPFSIQEDGWEFTGIAGMSYHGGLIGVLIAMWMYGRKKGLHLYTIADFMTPAIPLGFFFGRIGNFINGELYGRVTEASIGMYFRDSKGEVLLRHPSQLYEAFFEGIVLFGVIKLFKNRFQGFNSGLYVFGYGFFRFFIVYFRHPDDHLGFILLNLSMVQLLCLSMMGGSIIIWITGYKLDSKN